VLPSPGCSYHGYSSTSLSCRKS